MIAFVSASGFEEESDSQTQYDDTGQLRRRSASAQGIALTALMGFLMENVNSVWNVWSMLLAHCRVHSIRLCNRSKKGFEGTAHVRVPCTRYEMSVAAVNWTWGVKSHRAGAFNLGVHGWRKLLSPHGPAMK